MGVDPAEGGDKTSWTVVDANKVLFQEAIHTPDTSIIPGRTIAHMRQWGIDPEDVLFDMGGGGKEHADILRRQGYRVRMIAFGGPATDPLVDKRMRTSVEKTEAREERYTYKDRRAEMYGKSRSLLNPELGGTFGIDDKYAELKRQLSLLPLLFDKEGRLYLPAKNKRSKTSTEETLRDILGCSPDESDSFVLAVFGQTSKVKRVVAGAIL